MKKKRILEILPDLGSGGAERLVVDLAKNIDKNKFEIEFLSFYGANCTPLEKEIEKDGIRVTYLDKKAGPDPSIYFKLFKFISRNHFDVVHSHRYVLSYMFPCVMLLKNIKFFHTVHTIAQKEVPLKGRFLNKLSFRFGATPVAISANIRESIESLYRLQNVSLIYNGIPTRRFIENNLLRSEWRAKEGFWENDVLIVSVARLSPPKNHKLLLRSFATLSKRQEHSVKLLLAGEGPLKDELQSLCKKLGVSDNVRFLGLRQDIPDILKASDIFALASDYEGNPLSVMEAMSAGTVPVCTAVGGVPELIEHGQNGFLTPPGDESGMAGALEKLIGSLSTRRDMSDKASRKARQNFDILEMTKKYEDLFLNYDTSNCR